MHAIASRLKDEDKLADFLEDYLDDELNMICEDESIPEVAKLLMDGYFLIRNNQLSELQSKMNSLPAPCDLSQCQAQSNVVEFDGNEEASESTEEQSEDDIEMNE
ncbi:unnamed protein product [Echinostoma caproni]|uniref:Pre-rRNA-processing protein TSR2 homolog n=1 Tax=Echinostoma caproni TaxID=27848 RepID=A0A183AP49_9TREM|nr:unnamed protein product [Echinostoma caproni]